MAQAGPGKIRLFNDFGSVGATLATTADNVSLGDFYAGGEGIEDTDAGVVGSALLSGSLQIIGANTDKDTTFVGTSIMFDAALMGPIVMEARIQLPDLDTKEIFVGLTSILAFDHQLEDSIANSSATVLTLTAENCGFYLSDELTASATEWHGIYNGGSATASTVVANVNLGTTNTRNPTAGEWQVLRLQVDPNGTATWGIDGEEVQKVTGAVSTTTNFAACVACSANTSELVIAELDYLKVMANRDWTV